MTDRKNKIEFGDFQTPIDLADEVCSLLSKLNIRPRTIIEPSCGDGSFLEAAARVYGVGSHYFGFDINPDYIARAERRMRDCHPNACVTLKSQDFFTFDWKQFLKSVEEPILFLGNPPWVTNSALGALSSGNLPKKSNLNNLSGLDALTGKANFDISEWMILKLIEAGSTYDYSIALLCKSGVARKALERQWRAGMTFPASSIYRIDAAKWFNVAVDACLFVAHSGADHSSERGASVYSSINSACPHSRFGFEDGQMVSDVDAYRKLSQLNGINYYRWRSGVKHDLSKVMELRRVDGRLLNGFGVEAEVEDLCLYPLLKATELSKGIAEPEKFVLITQHLVGESTDILKQTAPLTYRYLEKYESLFADRKSSIYRGQPKYCLFGIGSYTFLPYKIAISGLHKTLKFTMLEPRNGKPIIVDDTCYFIGSNDKQEACLLLELLNSEVAKQFLASNIFIDSKRPVTADVLNRIDLKKVSEQVGRLEELETYLRSGNSDSKGQGLLVFEKSKIYVSKSRKNVNNSPR